VVNRMVRRKHLRSGLFVGICAAMTLLPEASYADADDALAGLFDAVAGVPFATTMLGIVRSDERVPTTPAVLDQRLAAVEALLVQFNARLQQLETRVDQLQVEAVKTANLARLREYQRLSGALSLVTTELKTHPSDQGRRVVLEATARQLIDSIRDTPQFDLWMWTDIDPQSHLLRTRFKVTPSFEIYSYAAETWFATLAVLYDRKPQALISNVGPDLKKHAEFLRTHARWNVGQPPVSLPEYLNTAVFCRPAAMQQFADNNGSCRFGTECVDNIDGKISQGDEFTLDMGRPAPGASTLCTWDPNRQWNFPIEDKLRNDHGEELMTALADAMEKIANTGSQADPVVGTFADWVMTPLFSVPLDQPLSVARGSGIGSAPVVAACGDISGCRLPATGEAAWQVATSTQVRPIKNKSNSLCLDVKNNAVATGAQLVMWRCNGTPTQDWEKRPTTANHYRLASAHSNFCVTVANDPPPPPPGSISATSHLIHPQRLVFLQPCGNNPRQEFANVDSTIQGPN